LRPPLGETRRPVVSNADAPWRVWLDAARPRTLPAAIAPVVAATGLAIQDEVLVLPAAVACLGFALLIQIGTNFANDYFDFVKGADTAERVGPRRAVAAGLVAPATMRAATIAVFIAAFLVGLTLLPYGGWPLLVVGVLSILCGVAYTGGPYPLAYHGWGDAFVFVFFGLVAVAATYFVQAGRLVADVWVVAAGIGALATNILVVNNYRDIATDRKAGKHTLAVRLGPRLTRWQFLAGHAVAWAAIAVLGVRGRLGVTETVLLGLLAVVSAVRQAMQLKGAATPAALIALLGGTGRYLAGYSILLGAALAMH
jgi:1,4-dihydroxy-2-naphthoate polyprenyltransferase